MKLYIITDSISPKAGEWYGTKSNDVYYIDAVDGKYLEVDHYFYAIRDTSPRVQNEEVKKNEFLQEKPFKFASKNEAMKWLKKKHTNDSCRDSNEDIKSAIKNLRLQKGFRLSKEGKDALGKKYDYEFVSNKTYNSQNEFNSDANKIADYLDSIEDKYGTRITYNAVVGKSDKKAHFNVDFLRMKDSTKDKKLLKKDDDKKAVFIWASNKLKEASKHGYKAQLYPQNPEAVNERDREIQIDIFPPAKGNDYYNHFIAVVNEVYNKMKSAGIDVIKS